MRLFDRNISSLITVSEELWMNTIKIYAHQGFLMKWFENAKGSDQM